ncbi:hypothetical protein GALMADRAFT_1344132 [Galerina marginata CBS 339.88]|uniref:Uncharacterized protein n=1 Tax=Galerina marginata (strain CBS 339.88) TaxID=685588 RepID=A0A067SR29_GALM3|nr:hypothetical protein GALMADRAFT_1344132 [Galerina marginata CBS 339.88]
MYVYLSVIHIPVFHFHGAVSAIIINNTIINPQSPAGLITLPPQNQNQNQNANHAAYPASTYNERAPFCTVHLASESYVGVWVGVDQYPSEQEHPRSGVAGAAGEELRSISTEKRAAKWRPPTPAGGGPPGSSSGMMRSTPSLNLFSGLAATASAASSGRPAHLATPPGLGSSPGQHQNQYQHQHSPVSSSSSLAAATVNANANTTTTSTGTPPTRCPSLASPLPTTPLVPSAPLTKRFAGGVPAPLNLAGSSTTSLPASGASTTAAAAANSSAAKSRLGSQNHTRHISSLLMPIRMLVLPLRRERDGSRGRGAGVGADRVAVNHGDDEAASSETHACDVCWDSSPFRQQRAGVHERDRGGASGASGPAAVGYTKRKKEALSLRRERKTVEEREREMARGTWDSQFEMGAGALELELGRGLGISGAGYGRAGEAWIGHSPASSSTHLYGQFSSSLFLGITTSSGRAPLQQEREREELERVARMGEVLDDHVDLDADLEEAPWTWRAASQQPSINHNQGQSRSQPSSFGRSKGRRHSIATSISLLDVYPSPNKEEPSHNSSAAAFHRNLNVDTSSSFIQRRKAIHSFASMDSGLDLAPSLASNTEEPHPELGPDRVNGASGRIVAVGGREDATWDAYGLRYRDSGMGALGRRTAVGAGGSGGREKEKEKPSLGRSLPRKVSGRWRKHGGVVVGIISNSDQDRSKERGPDRVLPHVLGRSSMQERGLAGSASRRGGRQCGSNKFADFYVGVEEDGRFRGLGAGTSPEMDVHLNSEDEEEVDESKEVELPVSRPVYLKDEPGSSLTVSNPVGGGGSESQHHNQKTEAEAKPKHLLHGSRSMDSSLKFLRNRGATASSKSSWTVSPTPHMDLNSHSKDPSGATAATATASDESDVGPAYHCAFRAKTRGSPPSLPFCPVRAGEFSVDFNFDRDLEGMGMDRSESPMIPSFSTVGVVNAFPSRRLSSISKLSKAKGSPSTPHPHSAGGIMPVSPSPAALSASTSATSPTSATPTSSLKHSLSLPTPTSLPPPPRPLRGAHRPGPGVSPAGAQGTLRSASAFASLPASSTRGGDAPAPSASFLP